MALRPAKRQLEVIPLPTAADLSAGSLDVAVDLARVAPHDGWGDLVVHSANMRPAMKLASGHNAKNPLLKLRVLTDCTLGLEDWKLQTRTVEIRSQM